MQNLHEFLVGTKLYRVLWYLWPLAFVSAFAFANLLFGILGLSVFIPLVTIPRYRSVLQNLWRRFTPLKMIVILASWSAVVTFVTWRWPYVADSVIKASKAYQKPLLLMMLALVHLSVHRHRATRIVLFTMMGGVILVLLTFPSAQVFSFGWIRLVPKYPWGGEVLGAGQAGCAASLVAMLLVGALIYSKSTKVYKAVLALGLLFLLTFVVLTGARSIALMTMVAMGVVLTRWLWKVSGANFRKYFVGTCLTFVITAIAMTAANPRLRPKGTSFGFKFRAMIWCNGLKMISRAPIFGYGPTNLGPVFRAGPGLDLNGPQNVLLVPNEAHNDPITWAMRFGLPGYGLYLLVLGSLLSYLWTTSSKLSGTVQGLTEGAAAAIVGVFLGSLFSGFYFDSESGTFFFLLLGIVIAAGLEVSAKTSVDEHRKPSLKVTHILFTDEDATKKIELIKSMAKMPLTQKILAAEGTIYEQELKSIDQLDIVPVSWPYGLSVSEMEDADIVHAHDECAISLAKYADCFFGTPVISDACKERADQQLQTYRELLDISN